VTLDDPFQPFLRPSDYSRYNEDSLCVREAADISRNAQTQVDVVSAIYAYINSSIRYDHEKATKVKSGYLPDPNETLQTRKGICFDYAALAAAMLRSQGVPCKLVFGYVAPNELYHAWNMFYTEETGWVTVSFKANGQDWTRLDLTFTANGQDDAFIGDGSNYTDLYYY
jgi:transglutaminase-like putative cysteine protease